MLLTESLSLTLDCECFHQNLLLKTETPNMHSYCFISTTFFPPESELWLWLWLTKWHIPKPYHGSKPQILVCFSSRTLLCQESLVRPLSLFKLTSLGDQILWRSIVGKESREQLLHEWKSISARPNAAEWIDFCKPTSPCTMGSAWRQWEAQEPVAMFRQTNSTSGITDQPGSPCQSLGKRDLTGPSRPKPTKISWSTTGRGT